MYISPNLSFNNVLERAVDAQGLKMLTEDAWLMNTEVRYHLCERKSQWYLTMVFVALNNPLQFRCRKIDVYSSEKKALTFSKILQRGIRKDARGTLKINDDAFNICAN